MTPRFRLFFDMDGVLVDFERFLRAQNELRGWKALTGDDIKRMRGAYREMPPIAGALQGIRRMMSIAGQYGGEVWLATKPPTAIAWAYADKVDWVLEHLPELQRRIILTHDKGLLGDDMDFLVDDRPWRANAFLFRGTLIQFGDAQWPLDVSIGVNLHRTPADWPVLVDYLHRLIRSRWPRLQDDGEHSLEDINAARDLLRLGHLTNAELRKEVPGLRLGPLPGSPAAVTVDRASLPPDAVSVRVYSGDSALGPLTLRSEHSLAARPDCTEGACPNPVTCSGFGHCRSNHFHSPA